MKRAIYIGPQTREIGALSYGMTGTVVQNSKGELVFASDELDFNNQKVQAKDIHYPEID